MNQADANKSICCSDPQFVHGVCISCGNADNAEGPVFYGRRPTKADIHFQRWFQSLDFEQKGEVMGNCVPIKTPYADVLIYTGDILPHGQKSLSDFGAVVA